MKFGEEMSHRNILSPFQFAHIVIMFNAIYMSYFVQIHSIMEPPADHLSFNYHKAPTTLIIDGYVVGGYV